MTSTNVSILKSGCGGEEKSNKCDIWSNILDIQEAKNQAIFCIPMIVTNFSYFSISLISVMLAGHIGELELAASSLASSWTTVTGIALTVGLSGALETLCGQAYGAKLYRMLGIYLQSSVIILIFFSFVISIIWFYTEPILVLLHQEPQVAKLVGIYMRYSIPGLFAYAILQCLLRFLQAQSVMIPLVICSVVPLAIHGGIAYVLVYCTVLGFKGAALAVSLSLWISVVMLALYVNYSEVFKYTWEGLTMECFEHVLPNMKLAISSAVLVCLDYWAYEILVLLAGLMPDSENSISLIVMCINTQVILYMVTSGFSAAVSTRVSNEIGAGNGDQAKNSVVVTLKLSVLVATAFILSLMMGHNVWASAFTKSPVIKKNFAYMTPLLAISSLIDSAHEILSGVFRGCGWQHLAAWTSFTAIYVIALPIAIIIGFKAKMYSRGLWVGLICGLFFETCALLIITLRSRWTTLKLSVSSDKNKNMPV